MKNPLLKFVALLLLLPVLSAQAEEQTTYHPQGTWWINGGYGLGWLLSDTVDNKQENNTDSTDFVSASFNYAVFDNQFIEVRTAKTGGYLNFLNCLFSCDEHLNSVTDVGILYGLMKKEKWYMVGASAGLAYTDLEYKKGELVYVSEGNYFTTEHTYRNSQTLGIPLEAQFFFTPFKYVGIGLVGLANLNTEGSMAGAMLALQVGNLRR